MNKIMIIDDDPILVHEIVTEFKKWHLLVSTVQDWENVAKEFIQCHPDLVIDLVIMDVKLPKFCKLGN